MSLFGGAAAAQPRNRNLVEFKAGKMNLRGNMVYPDTRKGLVYLYQGNDLLMHLCWKDRSNNAVVHDFVIFPSEIEFKKVTQTTTGRVYVLKWKSNTRKIFFWMQEPKEDKDDEFCKKINDLLNHPPTSSFDDEAGSAHPLQPFIDRMASGGAGGIDPNDLTNALRGMDPSEFASLLTSFRGGGGPAGLMQGLQRGRGSSGNTAPQGTTSSNRSGASASNARSGQASASASSAPVPASTASAAASGPKTGAIQMSALTNVLSNLGNASTQETESSSKPPAELHDMVNSETLLPLLSNKNVQEKLRIYLPEDNIIPSTETDLRAAIGSPSFLQMVNAFSFALQSGELGPVLTQLGFPDEVTKAASQGDLQAFAKAIENYYKTSGASTAQQKSSDQPMDTNE